MTAIRRQIRLRFGRVDNCHRCGGRGLVWIFDTDRLCNLCGGRGRRRYG